MRIRLGAYFFGILFFILILNSFFFEKIRIDEISFSAANISLEKEQKQKLLSELEEKTKFLKDQWIWKLSISELKKIIQSHPRVEDVQIIRLWPNRYQVVLLSEEPFLLWIGNREFHPLTARGKFLNPIPLSQIPDLPLLRGNIFLEDLELRRKAVQLVQYLPQKGWFSQENLSEITYSAKDLNFYLYLLHSSSPIRIGNNLTEFRPDRVESVLRYLERKKIKWRVIDARFSQKVVVNLDNGS